MILNSFTQFAWVSLVAALFTIATLTPSAIAGEVKLPPVPAWYIGLFTEALVQEHLVGKTYTSRKYLNVDTEIEGWQETLNKDGSIRRIGGGISYSRGNWTMDGPVLCRYYPRMSSRKFDRCRIIVLRYKAVLFHHPTTSRRLEVNYMRSD